MIRFELLTIDNRIHWNKELTWFSWLIQLFCWGNHSALRIVFPRLGALSWYANPLLQQLFPSQDCVVHMQWRLRMQPYQEWAKECDRTIRVFIPLKDYSHRLGWLQDQDHKYYDITSIFQLLIFLTSGKWYGAKGRRWGFVCSTLLAAFFELKDWHTFAPDTLAANEAFRYSRTYITMKGIGEIDDDTFQPVAASKAA